MWEKGHHLLIPTLQVKKPPQRGVLPQSPTSQDGVSALPLRTSELWFPLTAASLCLMGPPLHFHLLRVLLNTAVDLAPPLTLPRSEPQFFPSVKWG